MECAWAPIKLYLQTGNHWQFVRLVEEIKKQSHHLRWKDPSILNHRCLSFIYSYPDVYVAYICGHNATTQQFPLASTIRFIESNINLSVCRTHKCFDANSFPISPSPMNGVQRTSTTRSVKNLGGKDKMQELQNTHIRLQKELKINCPYLMCLVYSCGCGWSMRGLNTFTNNRIFAYDVSEIEDASSFRVVNIYS